jgi:hypothetical protein
MNWLLLDKINHLLQNDQVCCIICDDLGQCLRNLSCLNNIVLLRNETSQGLIYSRNRLMSGVALQFQ